jgi:uncharacterized Ntn-hydrolase superfamily protein
MTFEALNSNPHETTYLYSTMARNPDNRIHRWPLLQTKRLFFIAIWIGVSQVAVANTPQPAPEHEPRANTFSIVAFDPKTGDLGIAVASKVLGVGSIVPFAKANVGAIATQSAANTAYGPEGLALLAEGKDAKETVRLLTEADRRRETRQLGIVDARGNVAAYSGEKCNGWFGHIEGGHYTVQGNLLAGEEVVKKMAAAFEEARQTEESELADWLLAALKAGDGAGGDKRGKQSAAILVVRDKAGYGGNDRYVDLRVEDHADPVAELARLLDVHKQFFAWAHRNPPERAEIEQQDDDEN